MRSAILTVLAVVCVAHISATGKINIVAGLEPIDDFDVVIPEINAVLLQVGEVHNIKYSLEEILNVSYQLVAGNRFVGEAHFKEDADKKKCNFEVITRSWEGYRWGNVSCPPDYKGLVVERRPTNLI